MKLRVRDVVANKYYKGSATKRDIRNMHDSYGCKKEFGLGIEGCEGKSCRECFDAPISKPKRRVRNI